MTEIDELSYWKNVIKERILNNKADVTPIVAAAKWLIEEYLYDDRDDEIPDWMFALANGNPDEWDALLVEVRHLIRFDEKKAQS